MSVGGSGDGPVIDARGLRCPAPVIRLAAAARTLEPGTVVTVLWTDPAARHDIPAWARMRGHEVVGTTTTLPDAGPDDSGGAGQQAYATSVRIIGPGTGPG